MNDLLMSVRQVQSGLLLNREASPFKLGQNVRITKLDPKWHSTFSMEVGGGSSGFREAFEKWREVAEGVTGTVLSPSYMTDIPGGREADLVLLRYTGKDGVSGRHDTFHPTELTRA